MTTKRSSKTGKTLSDFAPRRFARQRFELTPAVVAELAINPEMRAPEHQLKIRLGAHVLDQIREEFVTEAPTTEEVLEWVFGLVDQVPETIWCRVADALYLVGQGLLTTRRPNWPLQEFCEVLYKPIHEYHRARQVRAERAAVQALELSDRDLIQALGIDPIHILDLPATMLAKSCPA